MVRTLRPARKLKGSIRLPGDKSISHRYGMLSAIAEGESVIRNYSTGADCAATLECMRRLGAQVEHDDVVRVQGVGLDGLQAPGAPLDAGNSGSTIRMLSGILAGQPFETEIAGDDSLTRRPMGRIITPLELMGAKIRAREGNFPPLKISGGSLQAIEYEPPVASAQVKSAILFAGLYESWQPSPEEWRRTFTTYPTWIQPAERRLSRPASHRLTSTRCGSPSFRAHRRQARSGIRLHNRARSSSRRPVSSFRCRAR